MIGQWDESDCVLAFAPNAWSKGNGMSDQNTGNFPTYPSGAYQNCPLTNMGTGYGYVYNAGDGYIRPDGVNDYIDTQYGFPDAAFTVEVKFNYVNNGDHQHIMGALDDNYHYVYIRIISNNTLTLVSRLSSAHAVDLCQSDDTLSDGEHTLHFVRETDGTPKIYIDGSEASSYKDQDAIGIPSLTAKQRLFAITNSTSTSLASNVNWLAVYHAALSEARITANASLNNDMGLVGINIGDTMELIAGAPGSQYYGQYYGQYHGQY